MKPLEPDLGWNKKKVLIFLFVIFVLLIGFLAYLAKTEPRVKGQSAFTPPSNDTLDKESIELSEGLKQKIFSVKEDVAGLDVSEVATSSPQIQKIIKDIESIQDLPSNKVKEACQRICDGI